MPTSTQQGFSLGKWEQYYLRGRYKSHRNKVASAQPFVDSKPPIERPHVQYKHKKGLNEKQRQTFIMIENLRILNKTCEIMNGSDYNYYNHQKLNYPDNKPIHADDTVAGKPKLRKGNKMIKTQDTSSTASTSTSLTTSTEPTCGHISQKKSAASSGNFLQKQQQHRQSQPITHIVKKNTHVILRWFLRRFGEYVPWWAQVTY